AQLALCLGAIAVDVERSIQTAMKIAGISPCLLPQDLKPLPIRRESLRRGRNGQPPVRQPEHPAQCVIRAAGQPERDTWFLQGTQTQPDCLQLKISSLETHLRFGPQAAHQSDALFKQSDA